LHDCKCIDAIGARPSWPEGFGQIVVSGQRDG
jgi:hypothetical protein